MCNKSIVGFYFCRMDILLLHAVSWSYGCSTKSPMYKQKRNSSSVHWWLWYVWRWFRCHECLYLAYAVLYIGIGHNLQFICYNCEPLAITLARAGLWPATPHNPHYAFSFALLDWAETLIPECQIALKGFCKSLKFRYAFHNLKVCTVRHACR